MSDLHTLKKLAEVGAEITQMGLAENIPDNFGEKFGIPPQDRAAFRSGFMYAIAKAALVIHAELGLGTRDIDEEWEDHKKGVKRDVLKSDITEY